MARRGRRPTGPQLVEHLDGSPHAKTRLKVILETLAGRKTIPEACGELGIHEARFHKLRNRVLQTALGRLEPRPAGRPPRVRLPEAERIAELEEDLVRQRIDNQAAEVRRMLVETLPRLAHAPAPADGPGEKTTRRRAKRRRPRRPRR